MTRGLTSAGILALFVAAAIAFARVQSIWIDETTQLSGLALPPGQQLSWLLGRDNPIPGVPPDRMPPLSYWLGSLWAGLFGLGESSMRLFGITMLAAGAPAIYLAGRMLGGARGGALAVPFALAAIYLAPGTLVLAGEIRAYPLFLAFGAWAVWAYVGALTRPGTGWLVALALFSLLAAYTHFFGVVMAALLWLSLLIARWLQGEAILPVLVGGVVTALLCLGLAPFVLAAMQVGEGSADAAGPGLADLIRDLARLAFRLQLHGVHLSHPLLAGTALLGVAGLLVLSLAAGFRSRSDDPARVGLFLLLPAVLAFVMLGLLKLTVGSFDVLAPQYNSWIIPLVVLALSIPLTLPGMRPIAVAFAALLIGANLVADWTLLRNAVAYTHGPGEWVAEAIGSPEDTVVIHDASSNWGTSYFPVYYLTGGKATQILRQEGQPDRQILVDGIPEAEPGLAERFPTRLFVRSRSLTSSEIGARLDEPGDCGIPPMETGEPAPDSTVSRCAYESATMSIQRR
ncbi:glycosyltransferase family 39 protein [Paracoccus marinaquae]|uniref:Glycosyltransferase family 39 protein n=1 Tax=Paracoccus marinaquae TaxID=2841926 RepID=A0ABS6AK05_9RHOB|nr:glycosyltransferase family 39 protein [Paracoccus marinaquae]MBU3029979.1 glycosyltransferase family 39 protein [Paracoccus marinaquae]